MDTRKALYELTQAKLLDYLHSRDKAVDFKKEKAFAIIEEMNVVSQDQEIDISHLTLTQIHVLHEISEKENTNVTLISNIIGITKGGVSKAVSKLIQWGLVHEVANGSSKREIHYKLTQQGVKLSFVHEKLHQSLKVKYTKLYEGYSEEEMSIIQRFLDDLIQLNEEPL